MKKFIKICLLMAITLYALNLCLDIYVSKTFQYNRDRKYVGWNDIVHTQLNADVIIMGSSRAWVHYSPFILDSVLQTNSYNLGIDGSCLNRQIIKYNVLKHYQKVKPQYIIVNVDYVSAVSGWTIGYEREQFFPLLLNPYIRKQICQVEPFSFMELYFPIYRYTTYNGLFSVMKEASSDGMVLYKGYKGLERVWDGEAYNDMNSYHFNVEERTLKMFDDFLEARKEDGIQVIFCYSPIYAGLTAKVDNLQEVYDTYKTLADKYQIPILDYNYTDICADTTYFYNATHLTKLGSELFSIQLAHDLDSLGIISH